MIKLVFFVLVLTIIFPSKIYASSWFYPMEKMEERQLYKSFGQNITNEFYRGKQDLFPNTFLGIHAGVDLESLNDEKSNDILVPVYAVATGTIVYKGTLKGYGGVILLKFDDTDNIALYGHIKSPQEFSVNDKIKAGSIISYLGNNFSSQTSGERKHLHFAIHKGSDLYFRGHEPNQFDLNKKWEDPIKYLQDKKATQINPPTTPTLPIEPVNEIVKNDNLDYNLIDHFIKVLANIMNAIKNFF